MTHPKNKLALLQRPSANPYVVSKTSVNQRTKKPNVKNVNAKPQRAKKALTKPNSSPLETRKFKS
jgi:hypothetical protein